ncbi:MAG: polymer-forming cytoskeletal protein [Luteitalea sp.]|nr:polymer-forming cytoskeletal protein [Luteitalea sp.]
MWKRDEAPRPPAGIAPSKGMPSQPAPSMNPPAAPLSQASLGRDIVNIGKSVVIKGELNGSEDLTIEGQVDGKIELREHVLTIGANGKIKAAVFAKSIIVLGEVMGNITASEKVDIRDKGSVDGDITSPKVAIAEGAHFRGSIDMQRGPRAAARPAEVKPAPAAAAASGGGGSAVLKA